jgi:hypothetical protein
LNRRQFLWWSAALTACGLSVAAQRIFAAKQSISAAKAGGAIASSIPRLSEQGREIAALPAGAVNPPRGEVRLVVISDLNSQYGSTDYEPEVDQAIALIPAWQPDLVLCGGDMVAGQKLSLTTAQLQAMWSAFDQHVAAPLRRAQIPYGFTLGNHDASSAQSNGIFLFGRDRDLAAAYWRHPQHDPGLQFVDRTHFPFYYTFQHQGVFFLVWDASSAEIPPEQLAWVETSLASPAAQSAKLRMAIGHLPLHGIAIGRDQPGEYLNNAEALRSRLERYHVHTYISGHDHAYYPGHEGNLELLHCGLLGSGPRALLAGDVPRMKTLTVVDIHLAEGKTIYTTYNMQTLEPVNLQQLPRLIASPNGKVLRRDVQWADLTPAEQGLEYVPQT